MTDREKTTEGILIPESGVPHFTLDRVRYHLERANGNWNTAIEDALRAAERVEAISKGDRPRAREVLG